MYIMYIYIFNIYLIYIYITIDFNCESKKIIFNFVKIVAKRQFLCWKFYYFVSFFKVKQDFRLPFKIQFNILVFFIDKYICNDICKVFLSAYQVNIELTATTRRWIKFNFKC